MVRSLIRCSLNKPVYEQLLAAKKPELLICIGPAGTGKTMLACKHSMEHLLNKNYEKLVITRPSITIEENMGFLPGEIEDKMYPFLLPIYEQMQKYTDKATLVKYQKMNKIEIAPLGFLRGRTFDNTIMVADEMQNASHNQMMTLLTRIGFNSKLIVTGDLDQCDLNNQQNGLEYFLNKFENQQIKDNQQNIKVIRLDEDDIQRSDLVKLVLSIYKN